MNHGPTRDLTRYTSCPYNCWPVSCGIAVSPGRGGKLRIEGNPHHDLSRGRLCVKGQCCDEIPFNPARILTPLARSGERGQGHFEPISWDAALERIAARLRANIEAGRREANALYHSHGNIVQRVNWKILTPRFANLAGLTLWDGDFPCWVDVGVAQRLTGYEGRHDPVEMGAHSAALVNWAQDPCASQANLSTYLAQVRERGGTVVTIDPRTTQSAAMSDLHLRPRLGSDVFLANAVAHILVREGAYDREGVEQHCCGFERYREHIERFPPGLAVRRCEIEHRQIERLAAIFAERHPLCINLSRGALGKHKGGIQMVRAILCLVPLAGNLGVAGGGVIWGETIEWNSALRAEERRPPAPYPPNNFTAIDAALEGGAIDTLLVVGANPLSQWPHLDRLRRQLRRLGLIVVHDLFLNHTAREVADIVLPATCWLEELGLRTSNRRIYLMDQVLMPPGQCREASAWMKDLAARLGMADYFPWAHKEAFLEECLDSPACRHASVERLRSHPGGIVADLPEVPYADGVFDSPSGRFELYSSLAEELGIAPLPVYEPPLESPAATPELAARFPLQLISSRRNSHFHSFHDSHRVLATLRALEPEPLLLVHPRDAANRGIADGAWVRLFNERGQARVRVELSTEVAPGQVSLNDGWPELNEVTPAVAPCPVEVTRRLGIGGQPAYQNTLVEIEEADP